MNTTAYGHTIDLGDLIKLINYMERHRFKVGLDFHFVWGFDAPNSHQFLTSRDGRSLMVWRQKLTDEQIQKGGNLPTVDEQGYAQYQQLIVACIERMKDDEAKSDHLEVWD